jgi:AcrR family transcriptional regulator
MSIDRSAIPYAERRGATRRRIVAAASDAVLEKGFHAATLDEIAARAGVTKGAIYGNFPGKDELLVAVIRYWPNGVDAFPWPRDPQGSLRERLRRLGAALAKHLRTAETEARLRAELTLYVLTHPKMQALLADFFADWIRRTEAHLAEFIAPEEISVPLADFALAVDALIAGLLYARFQTPHAVGEAVIVNAFEALAGPGGGVAAPKA